VVMMKREEFQAQIEGYIFPQTFHQDLLDRAAEMFMKWGRSSHLDEKEHLFQSFGLNSQPGDDEKIKAQKAAIRVICSKMMDASISRKEAADIIRNFNRIKDPGYKWLD